MIKKDLPEVDVDEIMKRIRAEVEKRKALAGNTSGTTADATQQNISQPSSSPQVQNTPTSEKGTLAVVGKEYSVNELCQHHDTDFITNAYKVILHREPDSDEVDIWRSRFRAGELTKKQILAQLRFGSEGRKEKAAVRGLLVSFILHRSFKIPVLGRLLRTLGCIVNLPILFRNIQGLEYTVNIRFDQLNGHIDEVTDKVQAVQVAIAQKADEADVNGLNGSLQAIDSRLIAILDEQNGRIQETQRSFQELLEEVHTELADVVRKAREYKFNVLAQQRRLDDLLMQGQIPRVEAAGRCEPRRAEEDHVLDALYVSFEDRFRGSREDIKERQKVYLPYIEKVRQETGGGVVLDVGCGRGEWLELLAKEGYAAKGIDINRMMVVQSRELGLDVEEGDVFDYFTELASESLSVVTGFHIVEHLPLKTMITLFDQAYRVLKPGGMIIFETPNPENIIVGSCNFYYDPTHRNPIPPEALSFLVEARGYRDLKIVRLHEDEHYADLKETDISEKITSRFSGAQDYSVIGYKA